MTKVDEVHCPNCGSDNVSIPKKKMWFLILFFLLFVAVFPVSRYINRKDYHCFECGYDFNKDEVDNNGKEIPPLSE